MEARGRTTAAMILLVLLVLAATPAMTASAPVEPVQDVLDRVADPAAAVLLSRAFAEIDHLQRTIESLQRSPPPHGGGIGRRLQRTGTDVAAQARAVHIYTRTLQRSDTGQGRRQAQSELSERCFTAGAPGVIDVEGRTAEVNAACCSSPDDDCSSGMPAACSAGCAEVLLPFWQDCSDHLRINGKAAFTQIHRVVQECQEADVSRAGESLAMQLSLSCTDGSDATACVPECSAELHGEHRHRNFTRTLRRA
eukprot:COSAG06_NODE_7921_length_2333_cov_2.379141_2_plen_252_part_00